MMDWRDIATWVLQYTGVFVLHATIGVFVVLFGAWLLFRFARSLGWMQRGDHGPGWIAPLLRVATVLACLSASLFTGIQTGTIETALRAIEDAGKQSALSALMLAGKPLGITRSDQVIGLEDAKRLATQWAPSLTHQSSQWLDQHEWWKAANTQWKRLPEFSRDWINQQLPQTRFTTEQWVERAWRAGVAPALASARVQAHGFAYLSGFALIALMAALEWGWLWYTRSKPNAVPTQANTEKVERIEN